MKARPWGVHASRAYILHSGLKYLHQLLSQTIVIAHSRMLCTPEPDNNKICVIHAAEDQNLSASVPLMNNLLVRSSEREIVSADSVLDLNSMQWEAAD